MDVTKLRSDSVTDKPGVREGQSAAKASKARKATDSSSAAPAENLRQAPSEEKVKWSGDALALQEGIDAAKSAPDTRSEKVAQLKAAIQAGTYKVNDKAVAEKMIQHHIEDDVLTRME